MMKYNERNKTGGLRTTRSRREENLQVAKYITLPGRFHATRGVHGIPEETVTWHLAADDAGHDRPGVGPASYL